MQELSGIVTDYMMIQHTFVLSQLELVDEAALKEHKKNCFFKCPTCSKNFKFESKFNDHVDTH